MKVRSPKHITLHRADAAPASQNQSVVVHADPQSGISAAPLPGNTVADALKVAYVPEGHTILHPETGEKMWLSDDLYEEVNHGDTVQVVKS